jgi:uncharacterized protein YoaH (UPF0181 family)
MVRCDAIFIGELLHQFPADGAAISSGEAMILVAKGAIS